MSDQQKGFHSVREQTGSKRASSKSGFRRSISVMVAESPASTAFQSLSEKALNQLMYDIETLE